MVQPRYTVPEDRTRFEHTIELAGRALQAISHAKEGSPLSPSCCLANAATAASFASSIACARGRNVSPSDVSATDCVVRCMSRTPSSCSRAWKRVRTYPPTPLRSRRWPETQQDVLSFVRSGGKWIASFDQCGIGLACARSPELGSRSGSSISSPAQTH